MATTHPAISPELYYHEKSWLERARGLVVVLVLAPFATAGLLSVPLAGNSVAWQLFFDVTGWMVFVAGAAFRLWATLYIGGRKGKILVTDGPYSVCRNPLYLGNLLLTLSIAFFMQSLTFALGLVIAGVVYGTVTISSEEQRLAKRLGETFVDYCRRVPRLIPRLGGYHSDPVIEVDLRCLQVEARRALRYIWIPLICQALAHLRAEAWWPHLGVLP